MTLQTHIWKSYSRKVIQKLKTLHSSGCFKQEDAISRNVFLSTSKITTQQAYSLEMFLLVDLDDGMILDARFQAFGPTALLAVAQGCCDVVVGKNYLQAGRLSSDLLDKHLRDHPSEPPLAKSCNIFYNIVLEAIDQASHKCYHIPIDDAFTPTPLPEEREEGVVYPDWDNLSPEQQLAIINNVMESDIRPYVEMDDGGVEVVSIVNSRVLTIRYSGNCTSCFSAVGTTLTSIQSILRSKVHPELEVNPEF